jgi:beta-glucosidase
MPGPARKRELKKVRAALENGSLGMNSVDASVSAILKLIMQTGKFDDPVEHPEQAINRPEHQKLIRETGAQGMVLLKNENNILPLKATALKSMAVLGLAKECLAHGGGSAAVTCHYKVTPYEAFEGVLGKDFDLRYAQGKSLFVDCF